ncbi:molecular chaperone DnaJ [Candidatus Woesearchaeota archaeon]|nr:molecular chaperone DnaJ [Candidatus Woesearchaeota archaeon]
MAKKDYYEILGVSKDATKEEIKKAYKRLAKQYHPDINKEEGAAEKFKEINEAVSVLADDEKRANYDRFGTADVSGGFGGADFSGFDFSDFFSSGFDDLFESFFGGGRRRRGGPSRGSDLRYDLEISLEDCAFGAEKHIVIPRMARCDRCEGSGAQSSSDVKTCDLCHGSGVERRVQRTPFGLFQQTTTCSKCRGEGKTVKNPCPVCDGEGRIQKNTKIEIEIPKGADEGTKLRVRGEGEAGEKGGPSGDLYVVLHVKEHDIFERDGNDISVEIPISFSQACLGTEIQVPTLEGKAKLKIPAGTATDTVFRMKGKGIPSLRSYGTGSENVKVVVQVPKKLTKKQKELLKEFDKLGGKKKFGLF